MVMQMQEIRGQREVRCQKTESRGQKSEDRTQKTEKDRGREIGCQRLAGTEKLLGACFNQSAKLIECNHNLNVYIWFFEKIERCYVFSSSPLIRE
jgi:hypothetical protein